MNRAIRRTDEKSVTTPPDPRAPVESRPASSFAAPELMSQSARASAVEWVALAALLIALAAAGLIRIACGDIAWHLATARAAATEGQWPVTNLFSHTWPAYDLYQQYPVFQACVYFIYEQMGFEGLSLLLCVTWAAVLLLFMRWGGPWSRVAQCGFAWTIALLAVSRRIMLRPEAFGLIALAASLLVIDRYLRGRRWWILLLPPIQLLWVNSHQLYPLGWILHCLLMAHIVAARIGRWRASRGDRHVALTPVAISLAVCVALTACTPLGWHMFDALSRTTGSLAAHREHIRELAPIWDKPIEAAIAVPCLLLGLIALGRQYRAWRLFDIGLWLVTLAMTLSANRGLVFFALVSAGLFSRSTPLPFPSLSRWRLPARFGGAVATIAIAGVIVHQRWIAPPMILGGTQPGLGRSLGDWPEVASQFLRRSPPPGKMLNMPWSLGNSVIWDLPDIPTFVDPRFESYPRCFLLDCIAAAKSDDVVNRLIRDHDIHWVYAEHRSSGILQRVSALVTTDDWRIVHADSQTAVLVRNRLFAREYLDSVASHEWSPNSHDPADLLAAPSDLRIRQRLAYARFLAALRHDPQATRQFRLARSEACGDLKLLALVEQSLTDSHREFAWNEAATDAAIPLARRLDK